MGRCAVTRPGRSVAIAAALALVAVGARAGVMDPEPGDMALGSAKARVTVIEYASVGCPHCADWRHDVFPTLKAKYIDTGRMRFVVREMITGDATIATAGFMLARCAGPEKYFQVTDAVYARQGQMWGKAANAGAVLGEIAKSAGMTEEAFEACIDDQKGLDALNARVAQHSKDGVDSTPTFFVNGKRYDEPLTLAQVAAAFHPGRRA
ncbi:MAG TPA: DsbA family protein [Caulobacteraceae bacterium]|jgi:protein-disulfide isomerase|nr:DsbA family protein [Caulobacteraceae bacterium]